MAYYAVTIQEPNECKMMKLSRLSEDQSFATTVLGAYCTHTPGTVVA
jgi:hypothetical protein